MPRTRTDLVTEVLDLLGVSQVGQAPSAEDRALVDAKVEPVLASLARRNVVYVQSVDSIEDEFFNPVAVIVANNIGPKFGQSFDASVDAAQEAILRTMQPVQRPSASRPVEYF